MNLGHAKTSTPIINSPLSREGGEKGKRVRKGAKGRPTGSHTENTETKRDVNLARKTLFSAGKVVNGRLGSRLPR